MAMGSCYTCIKYLMFAFNFLFWILGCAILGVGIWVRVAPNFGKYVENSEHFDVVYTGAYIFIVVGVIIMVVGFFGCCGAIKENQCMLAMFFTLLFLIFVVLLGAGIWAVVYKDTIKDTVNDALTEATSNYFKDDQMKTLMDNVQRDFECCGATQGVEDYPSEQVAGVEGCKEFSEPCNDKLFQYCKENLLIIAGVAIGVAVIMILGMIFSMILCCALRDTERV